MPVKKGEPKPEYTAAEKANIVEQVCQLYETQNATLESCCKACGVSDRTFFLWRSQNADFAERYKKAKAQQDQHYWEEIIRPLAKTALQRHLEVKYADEEKDVVFDGEKTGEVQHTRKWILPNPTVTIFANKGVFPDKFVEKHEHTGPEGAPLFAISKAKQEDLEKLLDAINGE